MKTLLSMIICVFCFNFLIAQESGGESQNKEFNESMTKQILMHKAMQKHQNYRAESRSSLAPGDEGLNVERGNHVKFGGDGYAVIGDNAGFNIATDGANVEARNGTDLDEILFLNYWDGDVQIAIGGDGNDQNLLIGTAATNAGIMNAFNTLYVNGSSDKVGVGTSTPDADLHVVSAGSELARFEGSSPSKWISIYEGATRKGILWSTIDDIKLRNDSGSGAVRIQTNGNNDRLSILSNGNVGVGTTSPSVTMHVDGVGSRLLIGGSGGTIAKLTVNAEPGAEIARFRMNGVTQVLLNANGDLGIGTTLPSAKLDVFGDTELNGDLDTDDGLLFVDAAEDNVGVNTSTPNYTMDIQHISGIPGATSGNGLNINNISTAATDHWTVYHSVTGQLRLYHNGTQRGAFSNVDGMYTPSSDRRMKTNISQIENNILDKINLLKPSRYHFKTNTDGHKEYGLIAQEVQQVFPELTPIIETVEEGGEMDMLGVTYTEFVPILIKAIQEQQEMIEQLKDRIEILESND